MAQPWLIFPFGHGDLPDGGGPPPEEPPPGEEPDPYPPAPARMAAFMYEALPAATRVRDEQAGEPLKQLLNVVGSGADEIRAGADRFVSLIDVDTCPAEHLPQLGAMLGFEFPYDLDEAMQRNFVRSIVSMYRIKGTPLALKFVVNRLIAGQGFTLDIENEDPVAKTFDVRMTANEGASGSDALQTKIAYLVGLYSPAGMIPRIVVLFYFDDALDTSRQDDSAHTTVEHTAWSFNSKGHTMNTRKATGFVAFNTRGSQTLSL